eukprot:1995793-Pleurochrysis_carterae.AAC.1
MLAPHPSLWPRRTGRLWPQRLSRQTLACHPARGRCEAGVLCRSLWPCSRARHTIPPGLAGRF